MMKALAGGAALILLAACGRWFEDLPYEIVSVPASAETAPMTGTGDRADDPAVWLHPQDPALSLILGTNKEEALYVYGLDGEERQRLAVGRVNNVDVRGNLAVASNDEVNGLSWFRVEADEAGATVRHLGDTPVERIEPYGVCLGIVGGRPLAAATYKDGALELWSATEQDGEPPRVELARTVMLGSQLEGCVFDDPYSRLFIGEEAHGIWSLDLARGDAGPVQVDSIAAGNGLVADVEGLSLYTAPGGEGFLVASAQAADRFVVYERQPPHRVVGAFAIRGSEEGSVDGVSHTDGLEVSSAALPGYPRGVLIVQDDANPRPEVDQNFKIVDWARIEIALGLDMRR